jgi:GntR family transcriptional regulator
MSTKFVNPLDIIPKYFQLVNILRHKIEDGEWSPYQTIPSERQMEEMYNISRTTIREAIAILIRQGYLFREQGKGTFVAPQKLQKSMLDLTSFTEDMRARGFEPGQKILSLGRVKPPVKVLQALELPLETESLFRTERIRLADGKSIGLQTSYLSLPNGEDISREELEHIGSLYTILLEKFNLIPTEAEETIESTLASPEEAALLETAEGSPLLLSARTLWDQNRRPLEYVKILYRGDRYRYVARLTR